MGAYFKYIILLLFTFGCFSSANAQNLEKVINLEGNWYFSIGDNEAWSSASFNHHHWEKINVPESWERQGFNGYDGYAWYRKVFNLRANNTDGLYLSLGYIDDVDEVYVNGHLIGHTGSFPYQYKTAYNAKRMYPIPSEVLNFKGENTIAIRVYDAEGEGGIVHGSIAVMYDTDAIPVDFDLSGSWHFKPHDIPSSTLNNNNFNNWNTITVPGAWEDQGFKNLDGIACYAKEFELPIALHDEALVLILGYIDDLDQVYLNGILIGQSGELNKQTANKYPDMHKALRGYYVPSGIIKTNGANVLVVKVYDSWGSGGIQQGAIGFISQKKYIAFWTEKRSH